MAALLGRLKIEQDSRVKFKVVSARRIVVGNSATAAERAAIAGRLILIMQNATGDLKSVAITALGHLKLPASSTSLSGISLYRPHEQRKSVGTVA